ncbi:hypothetical protein D9M71_69060 [compost metagenome]
MPVDGHRFRFAHGAGLDGAALESAIDASVVRKSVRPFITPALALFRKASVGRYHSTFSIAGRHSECVDQWCNHGGA